MSDASTNAGGPDAGTGASGSADSAIADLKELAAANRKFQAAVVENSVEMNMDNKLGQKSGEVGK